MVEAEKVPSEELTCPLYPGDIVQSVIDVRSSPQRATVVIPELDAGMISMFGLDRNRGTPAPLGCVGCDTVLESAPPPLGSVQTSRSQMTYFYDRKVLRLVEIGFKHKIANMDDKTLAQFARELADKLVQVSALLNDRGFSPFSNLVDVSSFRMSALAGLKFKRTVDEVI